MKLKTFFRPKRPDNVKKKWFLRIQRIVKSRSFSGFLITFFMIVGVYTIFASDYLILKQIQVQAATNKYVSTADIKTLCSQYLAESILFISLDTIQQDILDAYPEIEKVSVHKELPDTMIVEYTERRVVLSIHQGGEYYYVAEDGFVFARVLTPAEDVPPIEIVDQAQTQLAVGDQIQEKSLADMLVFASDRWEALNLDVKGIYYSEEMYELDIVLPLRTSNDAVEQTVVKFSAKAPLIPQISTLETIVVDLIRNQKRAESIDLRFEKPVVRYL